MKDVVQIPVQDFTKTYDALKKFVDWFSVIAGETADEECFQIECELAINAEEALDQMKQLLKGDEK